MDQQRQQIPETRRARFSLSQESITVLTVGVALAGLLLVNLAEMRAERDAMRADARADRARIEASMNQMRAEGRADRAGFAKEMARINDRQGNLDGLVEGLQHAIPAPDD